MIKREILKAARGKKDGMYRKPKVRITVDLLSKAMQARDNRMASLMC